MTFNPPKITFWRLLAVVIAIFGLWATFLRFTGGLAAVTHLSDRYPWGLWIGFDILCGVGLAAGGFTITAVVYIFNLKKYRPIARPAVLTAFLGYGLVCVALLYDLGRPWAIWHPLVHWNPHSVMFEVGWCVTLYTTVLALEFSPLLWERLGWSKPLKIIHKFQIPLVIMGVVLSTLHQSSLGSLFLIAPEKLHPLWWTPRLPLLFYVSAIGVGLSMVIFESRFSSRLTGRRLEMDLLSQLGKAIVVAQFVLLALRFQDLYARRVLGAAVFQPTFETALFWTEILVGSVIPALLLLSARIRNSERWLPLPATLVVLGFMLHRLDASLTAYQATMTEVRYFPSIWEFAVSAFIVVCGMFAFTLAVRYLEVFPKTAEEREREAMRGAAPAPAFVPIPAVEMSEGAEISARASESGGDGGYQV